MVEISGENINLHLSTLSPLMSLISLISLASLTSHISHLSNLSHPLIPRILSPTTQYPSPLLSLSPFPSHPSYPLTPLQAHPAARLPVQLYIQYKKDSKHAYVLALHTRNGRYAVAAEQSRHGLGAQARPGLHAHTFRRLVPTVGAVSSRWNV